MKRALYIAPDATDSLNIASLLNERGYDVLTHSIPQGILWPDATKKVDVVVVSMDVQDAGFSPFVLVQQLRREQPDLPILLMLGARRLSHEEAVLRQGGVYCVTEPVDLTILCKFLDFLTDSELHKRAVAN